MNNAIGMLEFNSIAAGIETCDAMVKAAQVDLLRACTLCPGKYMVIVAGEVGPVQASVRQGKVVGGEFVVDELIIPNLHRQVIPAVALTNQITEFGAVGVLEFYSVASAIVAADMAAKAAQITLIEVRTGFAIGGKGFVTLTGDVGAVRAAVAAAEKASDLLVKSIVIPRPAKQLLETLL